MKNVVLMLPSGQSWNRKRPSLELERAARASVELERAATSPTNKGVGKDVRPDARGRKAGGGGKGPELGEPSKFSPSAAPILSGDLSAGVIKAPEVSQDVPMGWEAEKAQLKLQIETMRRQQCEVLR